jgi:hypothetical protein
MTSLETQSIAFGLLVLWLIAVGLENFAAWLLFGIRTSVAEWAGLTLVPCAMFILIILYLAV